MNPRVFINFFHQPTGKLVGFGLLVVIALVLAYGCQKPRAATKRSGIISQAEAAATKPQVVQSFVKDIQPFNPPPAKSEPPPSSPTSAKQEEEKRSTLPPISLFGDTPSAEKPLSLLYAPYGRLIPCELIVTVDSASIRTPIIGLVTEDVYHAGRLIIPAGTEVHGIAQVDRSRERIASGNRWTLVWQTGEELSLGGIALDRETNPDGEGWGITDGSAGLRGRLIKSDDLAEIKLFAATFLSGAAGALTEQQTTLLGPIASPTLQNAPLQGAQGVLAAYAKQIFDSIQRDGFYVRVPAGKQFYLYVTQTIDRDDAAAGESRYQSIEMDDGAATAAAAQRPNSTAQLQKP
jgi:hypothetical protein